MKIPATAKKTIDMYITENHLDRKSFYIRLMPIYERIWREMEEYCDCGGSNNHMAVVNLNLAAGFFALYDATDRMLTAEKMLELIDKAIPRSIPIITRSVRNNIKPVAKLLEKHYTKFSAKIAAHKAKGEWLDSWSIDIKPFDEINQSLSFDLIGCPIVKFAKKFGYMGIMPAVCGSDYITIRQLGARLIRTETESAGFARCKYTYVADKK